MSHRPYPETPAAAARNRRAAEILALVDELAVSDAHGYRARVRLACLFPPTGPGPSGEDVRAAVAYTAPPALPEFLEPPATPDEETDAA